MVGEDANRFYVALIRMATSCVLLLSTLVFVRLLTVSWMAPTGPILDFQLDLQKKHELIDALQELKMQEEDVAFLEAEYADTLANAALIKVGIVITTVFLGSLRCCLVAFTQ